MPHWISQPSGTLERITLPENMPEKNPNLQPLINSH
jgi:hypothetical protein